MTPLRLALATALLAAAGALHGAAATRPPNIVFVMADQLRRSATGFGGDANVRTPNLDRLAGQSANFKNAVSVLPVCTPFRAALLTGRFPTSTGMFLNDAYLPSEEITIAEVLQRAGYDTGYIGKWHIDGHGRQSFIPPERRQGFEYWKVAECDHNYNHSHYYAGNSPEKQYWPGYDAFAQTKDAQQYLTDHAHAAKPFFLCVSYGIPHFPLDTAPAEFKALYPPEKITFPPNVPPEDQTAPLRHDAQGYYAHIAALDRCLGDMLQTLREQGLDENTIVVFTSDHGEMLGSHTIKTKTKQAPWNEAAHTPFLLRFPNQPGRVVDTPITTPDIMPTLLSLVGVPVPSTVEGTDLSAVIREGRELRDHVALFMSISPFAGEAFTTPYRAIRTDRYTFVRNLEGPWLAFDEEKDPYERHNLLENATDKTLVMELDRKLNAALAAIHDDFRAPPYYVQKFGFELARNKSVSYAPGAKVQSPRRIPAPAKP